VARANDRWVFGSGPGIGEGSLELHRFVRAEHPHLTLVWLARDEADVSAARVLGMAAFRKSSARGLLETLRARVVVVTHGFGDVNRYGTRSAIIVQLWHGIPLKLIQLDSPATLALGIPGARLLRGLLRSLYRRGFSAITVLPAASECVAVRLRTAFALTAQVVVTGDPRNDVLARTTVESARAHAFALIGCADTQQRLLLFAPTWRDGESDPGAPDDDEWMAISAALERNDTLLVVRPHPLGVGEYGAGPLASDRILLLGADRVTDITPLLRAFDALITDYSSIAFDFSLTGGPIFFLAPDEESYTTTRGLYEPYRVFSGGREVRSWAAILLQLERYTVDSHWAADVLAHTERLANRHFAFRDGENTARVYKEIAGRVLSHGVGRNA